MTSNNGQFDTIDAGKLIGKAVGDALAQSLPPLLAAELIPALADALVPVLLRVLSQAAPPHVCDTCVARRISWEKANRTALEDAMAAARAAAGDETGSADFSSFLPERLRAAGIPAVNQAITTEQGTDKCAEHVSGVQGGAAPLLVATANVPPGALTQPARLLPG